MSNPYTTTPGKVPPLSYIARPRQTDDIIDEFCEEYPSNQIYRITGLRGTGKTVALREIGKVLSGKEEWIVINLNVDLDLFGIMYDALLKNLPFKGFKSEEMHINLPGLEVDIHKSGNREIASDISQILCALKKQGKRVFIALDEIYDSDILRAFISQCQIWVGEDMPVFLVAAGLSHNLETIARHRNMTFFKRAPMILMQGLNLNRIVDDYTEKFKLDRSTAVTMAKLTKGYAYAFQLLGYLCWKHNTIYTDILDEFDKELDNNSYQLIWNELNNSEKKALIAIAKAESTSIKDIRAVGDISSASFNQTKKALEIKDLIDCRRHGEVKFSLPRFREFVFVAEELYE